MFKFIIEGAKDNLDEKLKSPFWGSMVVTWLTWNWEVWYTTIFVSEKLTGNKVIYIKEMYNYFDFYNLFPCLGILFHWIIMPLFLSMFIIKAVTPYLSLRFLKKHKENKVEENNIKVARLESENRVLEFEKKELEYKKQQEELKASLSEAIHKSKLADNNSKSEEEKRDEDYKKITTYDNLILKNIGKLIFDYKGNDASYNYDLNDRLYNIDIQDIKNGVLFNLIDIITKEEHYNVYELTKKGKYFLKKYALEEQKKENS